MAERSVSVRLRAEISGYMASMRSASAETKRFGDSVLESATRNRAELEHVGRGLVGIGTAALAGLGLATKAAIDWETAWAGVTKTVDGSAEQMAQLEGELREMAKSLPATHEEIAAVAEAAGQLGIQRENVAEFTRVMVDLGETTNLSAEEAATGLARFSNIMQTSQSDVDRLGSVLVDLGNNAATTEAEILELGTRLAAAGKIAGLSESDVMAFASTLTSVGVEAEAGGTALSKVFTGVRDAVIDGSDKLDVFAKVAGTTASDFARAFEEDPARAIGTFVAGLGRMNESGQSTTAVFEELELTDQRLMRALLSTASAGDLLTQQLDRGNTAWEENTALTEEAQKRYETAAAQIQMAWNSIKDAAIDVGAAIVPVVTGIASAAGTLADAFGALPGPVKTVFAAVTGVGGVLAVASGAMMLMLPRIAETKRAMETLGISFGGAAKKIGLVGLAFAGLMGAGAAINSLFGDELNADIDKMAESLETFANAGKLTGEAARVLGDDIGGVGEAFGRLTDWNSDIARFTEGLMGGLETTAGSIRNTEQRISALDESLAALVQDGNAEAAQDAFFQIARAAQEQGVSLDEVRRLLPQYGEAMKAAEEESSRLSGASEKLVGQVNDAEAAFEDAKEALEAYADAQKAATDPVFALRSAVAKVSEAQKAYTKAVKEHGPNSRQAEAATWDLAEAVAGAEQAALDGDLSFQAFKGKLKQWVDQGVITQGQADRLAGRVKNLRGQAEDYKGDYGADLHANTRQASKNVSGLQSQVDRFANSSAAITLSATGTATFTANVIGLPKGVKASPGSPPLPFGADGGMVAHGDIRRFDNGGPVIGLGGPRDDKILARLSDGEFVVNADATARHRPLLEAINSNRFADGGMVRGAPASVGGGIDYDRLAAAMQRTGHMKVSGRLAIDAGRNGGLVGVMRDVAAEEARDEADWRGRGN